MPIISNSIQNNTGGGNSAGVSRTRTFRSGNSTVSLQEGQTLKGVVSDIHGNQITLSMEDGSSFTGKLPDANQYSIGQKAAFQITGLDNNTIYMKAISGAYLLDMEDTIEQALEEAALPKSDRNLEVVRSLLQNQQSISRENILSAIRLCAQYPDSDVNSVITMQRLHLPMTPESVRQFSDYQNQTHQILYQMDSLTDSIADMMNTIGNQVPRLSKMVADQILNLALEGEASYEEQALARRIEEESAQSLLSESEEQESELANTQETEPSEQETVSSTPLARMKQIFTNITDSVSNSITSSAAETTVQEAPPLIHEQAGFVLSEQERLEFADLLSDFSLSEETLDQLKDGSITARNLLTQLKESFPDLSEEQAGKLLTSKGFQSLVKEQFLSGWTLSPEQLKSKANVEELYTKMSHQFQELSSFSEKVFGKDIFSQVSNQANHMQDNLDFMRTLNDTFQYIQLPLKLQNQNTHGDLYVMTRKEALRKDPKNLKVLLHLDMDHLGTLDIQIARENTSISTKFYVAKEDTKHLLEKNIELLSDAINEQGYAFTSELLLKEKDVDIVNDFIAADAPVGNITRYNFDLRA